MVASSSGKRALKSERHIEEIEKTQYADVSDPSLVLLIRAGQPPSPLLPKKESIRTWNPSARKALNPLVSGLTGTGRAGKAGVLTGNATGARYEGQVLAGQPHGQGCYYAAPSAGGALVYEGSWQKGERCGHGTCYFFSGEIYTGDWRNSRRHGLGRQVYSNGEVYEGRWEHDRRHGPGRLTLVNGDVFVGSFVEDKREGLGTLYMISKGRKYLAEYICGRPTCGTVVDLDQDALEPAQGSLKDTLALRSGQMALAGLALAPMLPMLQLEQPNKVLADGIISTRHERGERVAAAVLHNSSTLAAARLSLLKHAFILLAGSAGIDAGVPLHRLTDLVVLSGMDPADAATQQLLVRLQASLQGGSKLLGLDAFLQATCHFRDARGIHAEAFSQLPGPSAAELSASLAERHCSGRSAGIRRPPAAATAATAGGHSGADAAEPTGPPGARNSEPPVLAESPTSRSDGAQAAPEVAGMSEGVGHADGNEQLNGV